jgi:hypothetical protein
MRKMLIPLLTFLLTAPAMAERFQDTIDSVSMGKNGEDHLIFLQNGRVVFLGPNEEIPKVGNRIEVELDEEKKLISIQSLPLEPTHETERFINIPYHDKATILDSYGELTTLFNRMNRSWKTTTECTDRAHIWSYEEWKRSKHISRKVFLFFTDTYIRRYNYNWWFHVSPYQLVKNGSGSTEYVVDRKYTSTPRLMKDWTDIFIHSKRSCPVTTYRHYRANKNGSEHCFAVKSNMYNRLPYHVRLEEDNGRVQNGFSSSEVNFSYRAFNQRYSK